MTLYIPQRQTDCVIDVSHWNGRPDWAAVKAANPQLRGVIAKATQTRHVDPAWDHNKAGIKAAGFLLGAYHFVTGDDAAAQVDTFLRTAAPEPGMLIALDWENDDADCGIVEDMVDLIEERLGRLPVMYLGRDMLEEPSETLSACDLWLPEYGKKPICPPGWTTWRLHQHTDGKVGDVTGAIAGIGLCDRSYYDETQGPIEEWWGCPAPAAG